MAGWVLSLRLKPLIVGVGPVFLGVALAWFHEPERAFDGLLNGVIILSVFFIQTATHFFNDVLDFLKGADSSLRKGPQRALQKGLLSPSQLMRGGVLCLFIAGGLGVYLIQQGGWPVFWVGFLSLLLAYLYTGGPYPLAWTGLADLFVLLFFGVVPVSMVFYLNTGYFIPGAFVAGFQCGSLALSLLTVNNLRDEEVDKKAGKKTLVVRYGPAFGRGEWLLAHYMPYVVGFWWLIKGPYTAGLWPLVLLPFSFWAERFLDKPERLFSVVCVHYLFWTLLLFFAFFFGR